MSKKNTIDKNQIEMISLDQLVPENHLVRKRVQIVINIAKK